MKLKVGPAWAKGAMEMRESILRIRAQTETERASRPSVAEWYAGRSVLVTGASGFLGRVLVEFLLRCCPDIGHVYVVLRPKRGQDPAQRLRVLLDVPLFNRLRAEQPRALAKVVPVTGDMESLQLGLADDDRRRICDEVSVVFHVAASVRFDDPFRKAVFTNLRSTREVVTLARAMPQLKSLVHVSTAYCFINHDPLEEVVYPTELDYRDVIRWAEELTEDDAVAADLLGSKLRGFQPNTYTWTKALAERLMEDASEDLPIVITRPSIVNASLADPMPGWTDNLNGLNGIFAGGLTGLLKCHYVENPDFTFDAVPVDFAIKTIILASWIKGLGNRLSLSPTGGDVVNVTVGRELGISYNDWQWAVKPEGCMYTVPYPQVIRTPGFFMTRSRILNAVLVLYYNIIFGIVLDSLARATNRKPRLLNMYRKTVVAITATRAFQKNFTFPTTNQHRLLAMMHPKDERTLDVSEMLGYRNSMDSFRAAFEDTIRGILVYVLKGEDNIKENLVHLRRAMWAWRIYNGFWILVGAAFLWFLWGLKLRTRLNADLVAI